MDYRQEIISEFDTSALPGLNLPQKWHLAFLNPCVFNEDIEYTRSEKEISGVRMVVEYAIIDIVRPWLDSNIFRIPFTHAQFKEGMISDGKGNGYMAEINTGMILVRYISIGGLYESKSLQVMGWIIDRIPYCPAGMDMP